MLVERKLAEFKGSQADGNRYWQIAPAILAEKIPNIQLSAIRLTNPGALFDVVPASVPRKLIGEGETPAKPLRIDVSPVPPVISSDPAVEAVPPITGQSAVSPMPGQELPSDRLDGPVGEVLKALAEDIQQGRKDGSKLFHFDTEGILCLRWPEAFKVYGLENKTILDEFGRRNWLVVDPMAPFRKVSEVSAGIG